MPEELEGLYYRGTLSPPAIEFASPQGKQLFTEALEGGTMEGFFKLISYYQTQSEINYCGIASLAMVFNALAIDPGRTWKGTGPWRWFDDTMLDSCEPLSKIKDEGVSFAKVAYSAYCNGANVEAFRTNESSIDDFRRHVISSASSSEDSHHNGNGHYSPIGGYHAGRDMVLILDVARFKYPPHWMPLTLLWEAMDTIDESTGQHRGFMVISRSHKAFVSSLMHSSGHEDLKKVAKYLIEDVPPRMKLKDIKGVENILSVLFKSAPVDLKDFIKCVAEFWRQEDAGVFSSKIEKEEVLKLVEETELFKHLNRWLASEISSCKSLISFGFNENTVFHMKLSLLDQTCRKETNLTLAKADGAKPMTLVSGKIRTNGIDQGIDMLLVPSSLTSQSRNLLHPSTAGILTLLVLALRQRTWAGIKQENLLAQFNHLTSIDNLPTPLQLEVLHLRRQLHFLMIDLRGPSLSG
ncbi:glutathione gamma-glutamylcysteinyltransferase [Citrus sinensis]|uniref:Glutathione gamma-glutamylcysteinyltransferase n=1 Tax=Citrus sinensis TaxID=2711 RepID=A0ACB8MJA8_CITSI|nr:glutathione gamma-glutamylcysteinyltransferase [Citrus sinensis]